MKKKYVKPSFKVIKISMNDICVGSVCNDVQIEFVMPEKKKKQSILFDRDETQDMWNHEF